MERYSEMTNLALLAEQNNDVVIIVPYLDVQCSIVCINDHKTFTHLYRCRM